MRCKRIMLGATMLAASAFAVPAFAAGMGMSSPATQAPAMLGTSTGSSYGATPATPATPAMPAGQGTRATRAAPATPASPASYNGSASSKTNMNMQNASMHSSSSMHASTSGVPLVSLSNANTKIMSAPVQTISGQAIGTVQTVKTNAAGKPSMVDISLTTSTGGAKVVQVRASSLRYDAQGNLLITKLTQAQIDALPAAPTSSTMNP